ncbi:hypothetical protein ACOPJQ_05300 [Luteimonas dalianensis]|uniref:hypothetical protein n=1 Tax=Luteimonas dalianensis TaxID=1148196 RepID=UPI003BF3D0A0
MHVRFALILPVLLAASVAVAVAGDTPGSRDALPPQCDTFTWDVTNELAALQSPSLASVAGNGNNVETPRIGLRIRHDVRLHPQAEVTLAADPGRAHSGDAAAGLLVFQVPEDGRYRVSLTTGHWVDVIDGGQVVSSLDHHGQRGCPLLRKVVEFDLAGGHDLLLQIVGGAGSETGLLVTPADP